MVYVKDAVKLATKRGSSKIVVVFGNPFVNLTRLVHEVVTSEYPAVVKACVYFEQDEM